MPGLAHLSLGLWFTPPPLSGLVMPCRGDRAESGGPNLIKLDLLHSNNPDNRESDDRLLKARLNSLSSRPEALAQH